jgi:hypothetical protein
MLEILALFALTLLPSEHIHLSHNARDPDSVVAHRHLVPHQSSYNSPLIILMRW